MQQAISIWKIVLSTVFFVICNMFHESLGEVTGANVETFFVFLSNLGEAKQLYWLIAGMMVFNALQANLGMQIIKDENAVFKQSTMLLATPTLWVYHMHFGNEGDDFSLMKLIGQAMLVLTVVAYMWFDRTAAQELAEELSAKKSDRANKQRLTRQPNEDNEDPFDREDDTRNLMTTLEGTTELTHSKLGTRGTMKEAAKRKPMTRA